MTTVRRLWPIVTCACCRPRGSRWSDLAATIRQWLPQVAFFHQVDLERELRSAISRQPSVEVLLGSDVERLCHEQGGVRLIVRHPRTGSSCDLRAGWVNGCDEAAGTVRRALGIRPRGFTSRRRWFMVDASMRCTGERVPFEFICDPTRPTVSAPYWTFEQGLVAGDARTEPQAAAIAP